MRKLLVFTFIALAVLVSSCAKDDFSNGPQTGEVDFRIKTSLPKSITTYSAGTENGGISNVPADSYDLRYICEAWTKESPRRLAWRGVKTTNDFSSGMEFSARLLAMDYDFVFWADFVTKGSQADNFYKTDNADGLRDIEVIKSHSLSDNTRDAYYAVQNVNLTQAGANVSGVTLKRPFGKIRLVASDVVEGLLEDRPTLAKIDYVQSALPGGFNALEGTTTTKTVDVSGIYASTPVTEQFSVDGQDKQCYVLSFDYIFASSSVPSVAFNVKSFADVAGTKQIGNKDISAIPVVANKLTTVIGNLYTFEGKVDVSVSEEFEIKEVLPVVEVESVDMVAEALKNSSAIKVAKKVSLSQTVSIPNYASTETMDAPAQISLDLSAGIDAEHVLTIEDNAETPFAGTIAITVPDNNAGNVTINANKAHVIVYGKYGQIIAETSPSTLVVDAGSSISSLEIKGGNVEIRGEVAVLTVNDANAEAGVIKVFSTGKVDTFGDIKKYKVYWGAATGEQLVQVLANASSQNNGAFLEQNIMVNSPAAQAAVTLDKENYLFDGNNFILTGKATQNLIVVEGKNTTIQNIVIAESPRHGLTAYRTTGVNLINVCLKDNTAGGLVVNGSSVTADKLTTSGNGWYGVNVGMGSGVTEKPVFKLLDGQISDAIQIRVDAKDIPNVSVQLPANWNVIPTPDGGNIYTTADQQLFSGGTGTYENPYLISNKEDILTIGRLYMAGSYSKIYSAALRMTNDIDMENTPVRNLGVMGFLFDGNGYTLNNVNFTSESTFGVGNNVGMFAGFNGKSFDYIYEAKTDAEKNDAKAYTLNGKKYIIKGGCIRDLTIRGRVYSNINGAVSPLGSGQNTGYVINVTNYAIVTAEGPANFVAGIISGTKGTGLVLDCKNYGDITVTGGENCRPVGGITAQLYGGSTSYPDILNPYTASVNNCENYGNIVTDCYDVGGIVGQTHGYGGLKCIANSKNEGAITGTKNVGGILGRHSSTGGTMSVHGSTNSGVITATLQDGTGGDIIGRTDGAMQQ